MFYQMLPIFLAQSAQMFLPWKLFRPRTEPQKMHPVMLHEDLQFIPLSNIQRTAQLNGQHDPAQIVNLANNTSRLHVIFPLLCNVALATT